MVRSCSRCLLRQPGVDGPAPRRSWQGC
jgi:hypothetical protein